VRRTGAPDDVARLGQDANGIYRRISSGDFYLRYGKFEEEEMMKLSLKAMAVAAGLLWGGAILIVGLINLADPTYGLSFIQMTSSVYPWFHTSHSVANVAMGTIDGLIDGAIAGAIFALLYNAVSQLPVRSHESHQQQAHA
jgi:hypothetical protein